MPSNMKQAEKERDAAISQASASLSEATTAKRQLAIAASEAATAKAEAATAAKENVTAAKGAANAKAATASKQAAAATTRLQKVPCKAALATCVLFMGQHCCKDMAALCQHSWYASCCVLSLLDAMESTSKIMTRSTSCCPHAKPSACTLDTTAQLCAGSAGVEATA